MTPRRHKRPRRARLTGDRGSILLLVPAAFLVVMILASIALFVFFPVGRVGFIK